MATLDVEDVEQIAEAVINCAPKAAKKGRFSKLLIALIFALLIAYTAIVLVFTYNDKVVPDSLTMSFFGALVGELSALGFIKVRKVKGE